MAGERFFEFDCDLCDYALGNVRQYLRGVAERPKRTAGLRPSELELLDFPQWFARQFSGPFASLADRIWTGVFDEVPRTLLSESELYELAAVLDDMPTRLDRTCLWEPYSALHARSVECVTEIRSELTRQTAEEWAEASAGFVLRLCARPLSLAEGIALVGEWVGLVRRLRQAMGGTHVSADPPAASRVPIAADRTWVDLTSLHPATPAKGRAAPARPLATGSGIAPVCGWQEAMAITGLKKTKLYDLFGRGVLSGYRDGTMIRFYRAGLNGYMKDRENTPATAPPRPARRPRKAKAAVPTRFKFL